MSGRTARSRAVVVAASCLLHLGLIAALVLAEEWILSALRLTGHFEDSADPLGAVTGNFDGMGISLGVLQWNLGSGSLQPMVPAVGEAEVLARMPSFGDELWSA